MTTITREHLELAAKAAKKHVICIPDKATGERCIEPRCTAMKERAYAAGVGSNAGLAGPYKAGTT